MKSKPETQNFKPLVKIENLNKTYGAPSQNTTPKETPKKHKGQHKALDGINLEIEKGHIIGLLGENGCGKTTLLKILAGVLEPTSGKITIAGHKIGVKTKAITSFLADADFLNKDLTPAQACKLYNTFFPDFEIEKARSLLTYLGLSDTQRYQEMSKGMREKLKLALTMSRKAQLYLLDEPISGIDPAARETLLNTILHNWNPESTLIISTHLITDIETVLDQTIMMRHGKILLHRNADEMREEYGTSLDQIFRKEYANVY